MPLTVLPTGSPLTAYAAQADTLLAAWRAGEPWALELFHHRHPRFLDEKIPWLSKRLSQDEIRSAALTEADARLAVARWYDFLDWPAVEAFAAATRDAESAAARFEATVDAVVGGDLAALATQLEADSELVRARSTRVTHFDPPIHRATLLHYVAANGVEGYRQKTPANAVEVARRLLGAGAQPDALADLYGGRCTTMSLLVSSSHPAEAGLQVALVEVLVDFGASVEPHGDGSWTSPLLTALTFGYRDAAEALVRRGARVDLLATAAGLNRIGDVERLLPAATTDDRHRALALAAQLGHTDVVRRLLDAGEDPNRYNPRGGHAHTTPLHQAALQGHTEVVQLLVERGARLDLRDTIHHGTPLGWAEYGRQSDIAAWLRSRGAPR
jgi:hypothetical protein